MIDREQLASELAKTHGIRVDADDPVLVSALLNHRLLDEAIARLDGAVRASADRITAAAALQMDGAKDAAATLITLAGEWCADRLRAAAEEASSATLLRLQQEVTKAEQARRTAARFTWVTAINCAIVLAGLAGFLLAGYLQR
jgi:CHASE3 domain sensor protein